jgi:hypothetical protein
MIREDYKLEAYITAERLGTQQIDVANIVAEFNLYEDITKPYLTGEVALLDDSGLINGVQFKGTETFTIILNNDEMGVAPITKTFIITEVSNSVRINDNSEMFTLTLIEPHLFFSRATPISRTYHGTPEQMISKLVTDNIINKKVIIKNTTTAAQGAMKVTFPYIEPLQAVELLRSRMTTSEGYPYVFYASLHEDGLTLDNLGDMLKKDVWNEDLPFTYSQAASQTQDELRVKLSSIEKFIRPNADDMLGSMLSGAVGSRFSVFDTTYGQSVYSGHHDINKTLKPLLDDDGAVQSIFDESFTIAGVELNNIDSRNYFQVTSSNLYEGYQSFSDEYSDAGLHKTKVQAKAIISAMDKNMVVLQVPGPFFLANTESGIGNRLKVNIFSTSSTIDGVDTTKSGNYLVTAVRHIFKEGKHTVSIKATKLTEQRKI